MSQQVSNMPLVEGLQPTGVKRDNHPTWYAPVHDDGVGLRVMNSLTETLEPFAPVRPGKSIKWYTCGPTVYDVSHMGHARAYLTFDILRRIMEDYFGYSVEYQMNITDIDDKIIKRARINKLLKDYRASLDESSADGFASLAAFTAEALALASEGFTKKETALAQALPPNASSRVAKERDEKMKELALKKEQFVETAEKVRKALTERNFDAVFSAASSVLGDALDATRGAEVTDQEIFEAHARYYERTFFEDMERLGVREPDVISRVTEYVPQVVAFVERIMQNGFAYRAESSIFFDTDAFTKAGFSYAKLKGGQDKNTTEDEMAEGEGALSKGVAGEKRSPNDFALWKFSKPGEPRWPSPWGDGRPGWHIECSVMASDILGENMDIHGGGIDLKFPHHDNECAQSEAHFGHHQWVNYFFHCGHLHIKGLKMSKSLKNFITIREALEEVHPRVMRLLFLANQWDKAMQFGDDSLKEAKEKDRVLRAFFGSVDVVLRKDFLSTTQGFNTNDRALNAQCVETDRVVHAALQTNFDTPTALQAIMDLVAATNQYLLQGDRPSSTLVRKIGRYVTKMLRVFGVISGSDSIGFVNSDEASSRLVPAVDALVRFRDEVRNKAKETQQIPAFLPLCDAVRDEWLPPCGVRLEDKPGGGPTTWKTDEPEVLLREIRDRKAALEADRRKKLVNQIDTKKKLVAKWESFVAPPNDFFKSETSLYSAFDEAGVPTKDAEGNAIPDKTQKKLRKDLEKYASSHQELLTKGGATWLREQRKELQALEDELAQ